MRNLIFLLCAVFSFYSCQKQNRNKELPYEKVYIVECNWALPDSEYNQSLFRVVGFSELDKDFNLHFAYRSGYEYDHYYTSNILIVDSLKDKVSDIVNKYPADTTFLYKGEDRIYDGNYYIFIFQKSNNEFIRIYFEPKFLPQDLLLLYNCLYEDRQNQVRKNQYTDLFEKFEKIIITGREVIPLPVLKKTIQFTPPPPLKKEK